MRIKNISLNKYLIKDNNYHKMALVIPGGGYQFVSTFNEGIPYALKCNEYGYHAFILNYRVKDEAIYPNPILDIVTALRYIKENKDKYKVYFSDYIIIGSSAGAHMSMLFSLDEIGYINYDIEKPYGLILAYPVVTMKDYTHIGSRNTLLGLNPTSDLINKTSVELNITSNFPKTYFFCGKNDKTVDPLNSINLKKSLDEHNVLNIFHLYNNAPHGSSIGLLCDAKGWLDEALLYMKK